MKSMTALFAAALLVVPAASFAAAAAKKETKPAATKTEAKPAEAKAEPKAEAKSDAKAEPEGKQDMAAMGAALGAAMKAAMEAPKGATDCESAYNGVLAMTQALEKAIGKSQGGEMPTKDTFVKACTELPPVVQKCMVIGYAMSHQAECTEAQNKLDEPTKAKMQKMMGK